jgi:ATP-binding cassette subfamily B protein
VDHPHIEFRNVTFGYSATERAVAAVSLAIPRGAFAAVVGLSGSGKSTLLQLLARVYEPQEGSILIDGKDLRRFSARSLEKEITLVLQDSFVSSAASAGSVGDATILLVDQGLNDLDPVTEKAVNATLAQLRSGRTVVVATHRLASVANADVTFVMDKGSIVESGNHATLLKTNGPYARLWKKQGGFTLRDDGANAGIDILRLQHVPILATLQESLLAELQPHFSTEKFPAGRVIVYEGDPGDRFYILVRGTAMVTKSNIDGENPDTLGILQDGDFFGEIALLKETPRTVTVRAKQPCICLSLSRQSFEEILKRFPAIHKKVIEVAKARYEDLGRDW